VVSSGGSLYFAVAGGPAPQPLQHMSENNSGRRNLMLHRLANASGGDSVWESMQLSRGFAGYVDLMPLSTEPGIIGVMYETELAGDTSCKGACALVFARVNVSRRWSCRADPLEPPRFKSDDGTEDSYVTPRFAPRRVFAYIAGHDVRDSTTAIWDPVSKSYLLGTCGARCKRRARALTTTPPSFTGA
jgi:hypothetical protein